MTPHHTPPAPDTPAVTVEAIMSHPLVTVTPEAQLWEARAMMTAHHVHHLLVADRGRIVAIISDRDIAYRVSLYASGPTASRHEAAALHRRVHQAATFRLVTIRDDASVEEATALILDREISALPVVDEQGQVIGIVTSRDLLRGLLSCVLPAAA
ncbi:MAG: CBS domain-containing protein [Dehalococcoidia bacterium]|nr:CBS domain-containing protein [Dehalococcoidia bacterium]